MTKKRENFPVLVRSRSATNGAPKNPQRWKASRFKNGKGGTGEKASKRLLSIELRRGGKNGKKQTKKPKTGRQQNQEQRGIVSVVV